jgi:hypothetical protein
VHVAPDVDVPLQLEVTPPKPPPTCPTITIEVGTVLLLAKERLFVRLIVSPFVAPVGTVITTGDHNVGNVAAGFNAAHVALEPDTAAPQL